MAFTAKAIIGTIDLDRGPAIAAEKAVGDGSRGMKTEVEKNSMAAAASMENSFKSSLKGIKDEFGKNSALGQGLKLLAGGGAIAGIGLALRQAEDMTGKIAELADAFRQGDVSGKEFFANVVREVPILGGMVKTFDNLREAITGEKSEMAEDAKYVKASEDSWKSRNETMQKATLVMADMRKESQKLWEELSVLKSPQLTKGMALANVTAGDDLGGLRDSYLQAAGIEKPGGGAGPMLDKAKELREAQDQLKSLGNEVAANNKNGAQAAQNAVSSGEAYDDEIALAKSSRKTEEAYKAQLLTVQNLAAEYDTMKKAAEELNKSYLVTRESMMAVEVQRGKEAQDDTAKMMAERRAAQDAQISKTEAGFNEAKAKDAERDKQDLLGGLENQLRQARASSGFVRAPNSAIQAEDVFGSKRVTSADVPAPFITLNEKALQQVQLLTQLIEAVKDGFARNTDGILNAGVPLTETIALP